MYVTVLGTLSRKEHLANLIEQVRKTVQHPKSLLHQFEVVIAIDNKLISRIEVEKALYPIGIFRNITVFNTGNLPPKKLDVVARRNRIAALHKAAQKEIGASHFVFCVEDDTIIPESALSDLLMEWTKISNHTDIGFIEGVQVGRWGKKYVGAWKQNEDMSYTSMVGRDSETYLEMIDGGGFYCFLTETNLYKRAPFDWVEPMGPDVNFGRWLSINGKTLYVDWSVKCGHIVSTDKVLWPDGSEIRLHISLDRNRVISKEV